MTKKFTHTYFLLFACLSIFLGSCKPSLRYFNNDPKYQGKYLLSKQKIEGAKKIPQDELKTYIKQKNNRAILGVYVYVGFYYTGKIAYDTVALQKRYDKQVIRYNKKIQKAKKEKKRAKLEEKKNKELNKTYREITEGNWVMRTMGEAPVVFDSTAAKESAANISKYLKSKGYFRNSVSWKVNYKKRKANVKYTVTQREAYTINEISYHIPNARVDSIYQASISSSDLKKGVIYDENYLTNERERIYSLMRNNGYYKFNKHSIYYTLDSSLNNNIVNLQLNIDNSDSSVFGIYTLEDAAFFSDVSKGTAMPTNYPVEKSGFISYQLYGMKYNKKILGNKIYIKQGELFSQNNIENIQRRLATLDMFKLVNIKTDVIEHNDKDSIKKELKVSIYTSPLKKYQLSQEYGLTVGQGFIPGPFLNVSFKSRNLSRNFEIFQASVMYSIVGQYSALEVNNITTTQEFNANISLTFPTLLFPGKIRKKIDRSAPRSKILMAYGFSDRYEYKRDYINTSLSYLFLGKNKSSQFGITPIDMYVIVSHIKEEDFTTYLEDLHDAGNNLYLSFKPSIVTSFSFWYMYNNFKFGTNLPSTFVKPAIEIGGNVPNFINKNITQEGNGQLFGLQYYEYVKLQLDLRHTKPLNKKHSISGKLITGLARPYGSSSYDNNGSYVLPYEKYFFAGGTNSNRAWQSRRLGPGSYNDTINGYLYEQTGEIIIETSLEYRFKIYKFLEGALFTDIGNVWTIKDPTRPGSDFMYFKSIPDVGIGVGYGIRFNFTFLIIRFDMGYKMHNPAMPKGSRYVLANSLKNGPNFNIGIGYPF